MEFEGTPEENKKHIRKIESALKIWEINYCITVHGGKSQYINIVFKGIPLNEDNKLAKDYFIESIAPKDVLIYLDRTNLGWTLSPVIEHPHWKPKYKGNIHKIIRGVNPLEQDNQYPKELLKQIKKSKQKFKTAYSKTKRDNSWLEDFFFDYCTTHRLPGGQRHYIIEKNLAAYIIHHPDRDKILPKYLEAQGRKTNTLKTWFNSILRGQFTEVSPGEIVKYIKNNNIKYEIPKTKTDKSLDSISDKPITSREIEILKDTELLLRIIEEAQNHGIRGEEDTILTLTNKITLRLVKKHAPTSSNIVVSDKSGAGKDVVTSTICYILIPIDDLIHRTGLSEKALIYWATNKEEGWTWDEKVFYLEDPEEELLRGQPIKVMSSGRNISSVVKDQELIDLDIPGKPVMIVTSYLATIEEEGGRRWDAVRVDLSENLTSQVKKDKLKKAEGNSTIIENSELISALQKLKSYDVIIPFASKIAEHLPNTLVMRTQIDKLIDYMKASAILHQYQREKDEDGRLIATWFDYDYARFLFLKLRDVEGQWLNPIEEELVGVLRELGGPSSLKEIAEKFSHSIQWIYNHRESLTAKGIIRETLEYEEKANKPITKIYSNFGYSSIKLPESLVLTGFNNHLENQNKEGFNGFNSFNKIYKRINKKRQENGLLPLPSLDFSSKKDSSLHDFVENRENCENLPVGGFITAQENIIKPPLTESNSDKKTLNEADKKEVANSKSLNDRIAELKKYCERLKQQNNKITYDTLVFNFDQVFIEECKRQHILIPLPDGNYDFGGSK